VNLDQLRNAVLPQKEQSYEARDTMLYALGLGCGDDPLDIRSLRFVYEKHLQVLPSYSVVLARPGSILRNPAFGIDWAQVVHGEQSFQIYRPLEPAGKVRASFRILGVEDKGKHKGALLAFRRILSTESGAPVAEVSSTIFLRGDGGQGSFGMIPRPPAPVPDGPPERTMDIRTQPQQPLIYRLSGDMNPLHVDPAVAARAGFDRPILHGLCTFGIACRALVDIYCPEDPARLRCMFARFSKPVYPGETIRVETLRCDGKVRFRARVPERDVVALELGEATVSPF